ncbi:Retrovirus-related Pol polyprotein from transposon 17.6 [Vitis vinifera]|uniref:Retrovirus-related Pol polyprotein from transposon 17.6 n=1 Tax=Vitis vinifera TaxID=29760 RepID=A0A438FKY4_VITVI|nr:Retrovirus-related Pol polyprotein from transposon 17.6 [Vitis vinifera]
MTSEQPPSKSWLLDKHPEVVWKEVPNPRIGQGRSIEGRGNRAVRNGRPSHPLHILREAPPYDPRPVRLQVARTPQHGPGRRIIVRSVPTIRSTATLRRHAGASITWWKRIPAAPKAVINYINGGPLDEEYDSKRKRQRLLQAASVRERVNSIRPGIASGGSWPIDGTIIFPSIDPTRILQPHRDALILSLEMRDFDVRRILIDPCSSADLLQNHDVFAWAHSDMKGIHPSIVSHRLNVLPTAKPVRQRVRRFHPDRQKIIKEEIEKLLEAGFIREVEYLDCFPLPRIDQIVDSTAGQGMLSFLDAFSGYHQIPMSLADEEKIAFITPDGLYCYKVMPFGLKNVGATYQILMTKIFKPLVGRTVEVYIDDIVVKSKTREEHVLHLQEVFHLLRKYDMKLNPSKCAFGVNAGKFLGFMVSQRRIEVSPDQVKAVMETSPPRSKKELQRLTGKLVALGRFIARFTDELRPFFLAIRKVGASGWTDSCQSAFEKIKHSLMQPPILSSPLPGEKLYMYLVVSEWAISVVLFRCPSPKEQKPIYYVSRALADVETRYSKMELTALALRSAAQKLCPLLLSPPGGRAN